MKAEEPLGNSSAEDGSAAEPWLQAQRAWMENWVGLLGMMPYAGAAPAAEGAGADQWAQFWQWWQQSLQAWSAGAAPIARATAEQFKAVQENNLRFMEFTQRAWEALAPRIEAGESLESALEEERQKALQDWTDLPSDFAAASGDISRLWQLYIEQWQQFGNPWALAMQSFPEMTLRLAGGDSSALRELSDLTRQTYQETFGRLVTSPNLGPTRELNEKLLHGFDAWFDWQTAALEYQSILVDAWQQSMSVFMEQLVASAEKGEQITSLRQLTFLWTRQAEEVFTDAFRSERYVLAQGRMLNAAMEFRIKQREIMEIYLQAYDLPTRKELDEAHRRIYELRKQVKALSKEIAALKEEVSSQVRHEHVEADPSQEPGDLGEGGG